MKGKFKSFCTSLRRSLAIVLAMSMMLSVAVISSFSVAANTGSYADGYEYTAAVGGSFDNDEVDYTASIKLYDYLDSQERDTSWGNVMVAGNSATWYPFDTYNNELSEYYRQNNVSSPLYFGNLNTGAKGESGRLNDYKAKTGGLYNYNAAVNNSKAVWYDACTDVNVNDADWLASCSDPSVWSYSYQGVVSKELGADGSLMMITESGTAAAPFFNDGFLGRTNGKNETAGKRVNTVMPFSYDESTYTYSYKSSTVSTHASPINSIYLSNSNSGSGANNLSGADGNSLTMNYGGSDTAKAIRDGKLWFNSGESGYGFFPFNNNTIAHTSGDVRNDLNYGFGMELTVDFTVPENGCIPGTNEPITFTFTGDDDVWIYIDGKLVVDLGGDHKDASCTLNFKDNAATYSTGVNSKAVNSLSKAYSLSEVMGSSNNNTVHTLKMFYMERGLIESNLAVDFSFTPLDNYLSAEKEVNLADVNTGLCEALSAGEQFTFTNASNGTGNNENNALGGAGYVLSEKSGKEISGTTGANGEYIIKDSEKAGFSNITDTGNYLTVSEASNNEHFTYISAYTVTDVQNNVIKQTGSGTSANFLFKNEVSDRQVTNYSVKFVNTPETGSFKVGKIAFDADGEAENTTRIKDTDNYKDDTFTFKVEIDLKDGNGYKPYALAYTGDVEGTAASDGTFTLKDGQTVTFGGIPTGADYRVTELDNSEYYLVGQTDNTQGTVSKSDTPEAVFTNKRINRAPATVQLRAAKRLDGEAPADNAFSFRLSRITIGADGTVYATEELQTKQNSGGEVVFDTLSYAYSEPESGASQSEVFFYMIEELAGSNTDTYSYDSTKYYVRVDVDRAVNPVKASCKYYSSALGALNQSAADTVEEADVVFNNYHVGAITVSKIHGNDTSKPIAGTYFKLYKVSGDGGALSESNLLDTNGNAITDTSGYYGEAVDSEGKVTFDNLDIFVNQADNDTSQKQWYCVVESKAADGYSINSTASYFCLPDGGNYRIAKTVSDYPIVMPETSGSGAQLWLILGLGFVGTGALLALAYTVYDRHERKKRRAKTLCKSADKTV